MGGTKLLQFSFIPEKSTQALNFFAKQAGGKINKMKALKLVFLADRYHLRKYGRFVTNDSYIAMRHGPVPSATRDILESNDYLGDIEKKYAAQYIEPVDNWTFKSIHTPDTRVFSESDIEALEFVWKNFGRYDQFELRDITHTYPEWAKFEEQVSTPGSCRQMDILDFLLEPNKRLDKRLKVNEEAHQTFALNDKERKIKSEELVESSFVESLWR